ncbi:alternate F1F0 ATPase, F1 subunit alpha [Aliiglaciecola sp. LCG003]|uniref:alternate F1F0 ATPase, F1 subunit alpha n=1 Tax=Aliiglaciecola sp. LCG003 TaxID=3053655 RepID=UPI00257251A7|nr:alternate F1F0 ATPase, F1 subunit alpha [Aliiglaciecola sp. LCG003]WJG11294.1 alternate F1F0 ATPase, F1 subunit alpha [Aliiglaciecola sp. LCG003]
MFDACRQVNQQPPLAVSCQEIGTVISVSSGIAIVAGLGNAGLDELLQFPNGIMGIAFNLDEDEIGVVLLGHSEHISVGDEVLRTERVMDIGVGNSLLGRVVDPLGIAIDGGRPLNVEHRLPIERPAPAITARLPVEVPLQTGIKVIDALLPIGRGQRELILGDRQTGKTAIAIDAILNQKNNDVICIYVAIGQKASSVAKILAQLEQHNALAYTVMVVAEGSSPAGIKYIAPYGATSIAEYFMQSGQDVLIVYDDLTQHARAYRELSLLLRRTPGREAFPGDIFYIHSRLLERSTRLKAEFGGGSLTALPIIETEEQNISAYIPTNLISITDGQIYLSPSLFDLGILPAVDVGKSVSRVGGKAQRKMFRKLSSDLKLSYAQFEELESFARFGARLDESTRKVLEHGRYIRACFKQTEFNPLSVPQQLVLLLALSEGIIDTVVNTSLDAALAQLETLPALLPSNIVDQLIHANAINSPDKKIVMDNILSLLAPFTISSSQQSDLDDNQSLPLVANKTTKESTLIEPDL